MLAIVRDVEGFILFLANLQGWSMERTQIYIDCIQRELQHGGRHVFYTQKIVWGRKPETGSSEGI